MERPSLQRGAFWLSWHMPLPTEPPSLRDRLKSLQKELGEMAREPERTVSSKELAGAFGGIVGLQAELLDRIEALEKRANAGGHSIL